MKLRSIIQLTVLESLTPPSYSHMVFVRAASGIHGWEIALQVMNALLFTVLNRLSTDVQEWVDGIEGGNFD